jgi:hypothetical protein
MKRYVISGIAAVLVGAMTVSPASTQQPRRTPQPIKQPSSKAAASKDTADAPRPNESAPFMHLKLNHAQKILEGIALEDFDSIAKNAEQLGLLTQDENWMVYQTLEYRQHSSDFERIAGTLTKAAKAKNLDGAALAYMELTMSCVNCHKHTRGIRIASAR